MSVYVAWEGYRKDVPNKGYWDQTLLRDIFSKLSQPVVQVDSSQDVQRSEGGLVFVLPGASHCHEKWVDKVNDDLARFKWAILVITSDEESMFPVHRVRHPNCRIWLMTPHPIKHQGIKFFGLPVGYPPGIADYVKAREGVEKSLDWSFIGNVAHSRRKSFVENAANLANGRLVVSSTGTAKSNRDDYYDLMASSKIIPCPSGVYVPDSFRIYEALEFGCIPIADERSPNENYPLGYFEFVFGEKPPFPIINDWSVMPDVIGSLLNDYDAKRKEVVEWWAAYKTKLLVTLENQIKEHQ